MANGVSAAEVVPLCAGVSAHETATGGSFSSRGGIIKLILQLRLFGSFFGLLNMTVFLLMMILLVALMVSQVGLQVV